MGVFSHQQAGGSRALRTTYSGHTIKYLLLSSTLESGLCTCSQGSWPLSQYNCHQDEAPLRNSSRHLPSKVHMIGYWLWTDPAAEAPGQGKHCAFTIFISFPVRILHGELRRMLGLHFPDPPLFQTAKTYKPVMETPPNERGEESTSQTQLCFKTACYLGWEYGSAAQFLPARARWSV